MLRLRRCACVLLGVGLGTGTGCPDDVPPAGSGSSGETSEAVTTEAGTSGVGTTTLEDTAAAASEGTATGPDGSSSDDTGPALFTASDFSSGFLQRYAIGDDGTPTLVWETAAPTPGSFALGVVVDEAAGLAITALPGANVLSVQDLDGGEPRLVPWQVEIGPTYVAIAPSR